MDAGSLASVPSASSPIMDALKAGAAAASAARVGRLTKSFRDWLADNPPAPNYVWGRHTEAIAAKLGECADAVEKGESRYVIISVPPRHGKSDLTSRSFPPYFLARFPDCELILATYGADLSEGFSRVARRKFEATAGAYGLRISDDLNQVGAWGIQNHAGGMFAVGIGGAITGRGAHILVIDDPVKDRLEAESETVRDRVWDAFRNDLMSRLAPAHCVVILMTRWHEDDLVGRILKEMETNPEFPRFEYLNFPACTEATEATENTETVLKAVLKKLLSSAASVPSVADVRWLFPERFSADWYKTQRAAAGSYAWQALWLGDPKPRTGRLLRADLVTIVEPEKWPWKPDGTLKKPADDLPIPFGEPEGITAFKKAFGPKGIQFARGWDLASSEKERVKDDPDFTVGTLAGFDGETLWIADVVRGQWSALARNKKIVDTALRDGGAVPVRIEVVAGYKDAYTTVRSLLLGKATVRAVQTSGQGDKVTRWGLLEPLFEAGRVKILRAVWNAAWLAELGSVPKAKHDDQADSLWLAAGEAVSARRRMKVSL